MVALVECPVSIDYEHEHRCAEHGHESAESSLLCLFRLSTVCLALVIHQIRVETQDRFYSAGTLEDCRCGLRRFRQNSGFVFASLNSHPYSAATGRTREELIPLMSIRMRSIRLAFTAGVALLQLFLLPASQLLHVGCNHSHDLSVCETPTSAPPVDHHSHAHCSHHGHRHSGQDDSHHDSEHAPTAPHDSDNCPICQVVLAARIGELDAVYVPSSQLEVACSPCSAPDVQCAPQYSLLSRGPPA